MKAEDWPSIETIHLWYWHRGPHAVGALVGAVLGSGVGATEGSCVGSGVGPGVGAKVSPLEVGVTDTGAAVGSEVVGSSVG